MSCGAFAHGDVQLTDCPALHVPAVIAETKPSPLARRTTARSKPRVPGVEPHKLPARKRVDARTAVPRRSKTKLSRAGTLTAARVSDVMWSRCCV
jgi:hypothetical protein